MVRYIKRLINNWKQRRYEKSRIVWRQRHPIISKDDLIAMGIHSETFLSSEEMLKLAPNVIRVKE